MHVRGSWRPSRTATYWPLLLWPSALSFSFSRDAQPEAQGPSSLLDDSFLYHILSLTHLISNSIGGPEGPFCWVVAFPTTSCLQLIWSPTHWLPVSLSYIIVQSPTQSLEWHVWSSSSGNNCHAVHRSLSSSASVYECTMGFLPCSIFSAKPAYVISSHNCHWNVSLPSGASLWNGLFGQVEGQYTTLLWRIPNREYRNKLIYNEQ